MKQFVVSSVLIAAFLAALNVSCGGDKSSKNKADTGTDSGDQDSSVTLCSDDSDCSDGLYCNGSERCNPSAKGADERGCVKDESGPCGEGKTCDEKADKCIACTDDDDVDGDNHKSVACGGDDCDDNDPNRYPGNAEVCDNKNHDEDCDSNTFGDKDADGDGSYDAKCCNQSDSGKNNCGTDCDDTTIVKQPNQLEICDGIDNDCDGQTDEDTKEVAWYPDADDDGYGDKSGASQKSCAPIEGYSIKNTDCDDGNSAKHPGQIDICDSADNDCDGKTDEDVPCNFTVTKNIGSAGGEVGRVAGGVIVLGADVPQGALQKDTPVSITQGSEQASLPQGYQPLGNVYELSTSGASLGKDITIKLPAPSEPGADIVVFYVPSASSTPWQKLDSVTVKNSVAEITTNKSGYFQVAYTVSNKTDAGTAGQGGNVGNGGTGGASGSEGTGGSGGAVGAGGTSGTSGSGATGAIWYVNHAASSGGDGKSWGTAFTGLQSALGNAQLKPGDQIWVAEGTYTPAASGGNRTTYFYLATSVAVYGGFHGTEAKLADRDNPVDQTITVLSGDLNGDDGVDTSSNPTNRTENAYHVLVGANNATLDGFTVTGGNANSSTAGEQQNGGGMYNSTCDSLKLNNVTFAWNIATGNGGGMYNAQSSYTTQELSNVVFFRNNAGSNGGGIYNSSGNSNLNNVTFAQNTATSYGGGMYNNVGSPSLKKVTFSSNSGIAGGMYNIKGSPSLIDATFCNNTGSGMYNSNGNVILTNATFAQNTANDYGGGMYSYGNATLTNVTFANNTVGSTGGGGICNYGNGNIVVANAVIWGNTVGSSGYEVRAISGGLSFSHSNIRGCGGSETSDGGSLWNSSCGTNGGGNLDTATSPFAPYRAPSGSWTAAPAYSPKTYQTTFTNASAPWAAGELVGMYIQPDVNKTRWLLIIASTVTTLTVWGDMTSAAASGAMYQIHSLRLASDSQCKDSGDNAALPADAQDLDGDGNTTEPLPLDLDGKPRVVNSTVDMGAFEYQ